MKILQFILPFLFVRNWHDGSWELSRVRVLLCVGLCTVVLFGLLRVYILEPLFVYVRE